MTRKTAVRGSPGPRASLRHQQITVALAGQPNVGKSTIFNLLTGLSQHVGNWPGKTIEYKVGRYHHHGMDIEIVDLPGTYSLTANSLEERIARDFIIREQPNVVVVIVNAAALERNLYLVAEMLCLPAPLVLGLNMMDLAGQQGIKIEPHVLEAALGAPVVPMVATKNQGLRDLMNAVEHLVHNPDAFLPSRPAIREDHRAILQELNDLITGQVPEPYPEGWVSLKLLEGDEEVTRIIQEQLPAEQWERVQAILRRHEDAILSVASGRYEWIERMVRAAVFHPPAGQIALTDRLDRIATHPIWGLGLVVVVFGLVFVLTYALASPLQTWLDTTALSRTEVWTERVLADAPRWMESLILDGVIAGVGTILTLLPILVVFFTMLALLEDTGYLTRAAYVMDRFMHPMGLHGKSCLVLCMGFGCNVPAVLGTRVIEAPQGRLMTILLAPLVPCSARMAVLAFLVPLFFPRNAAVISWGLVAFNLLVLAGIGISINRVLFHGEQMAFIMELPLYHLPDLRTIGLQVWYRTLAFLRHAGTIILAVSVVVWVLASFPGPNIEASMLAGLGRLLAPIGSLMGLDWRMMVALLSSFIAKENAIATLGVLYHAGRDTGGLARALVSNLSPSAALAFLVVQMLFIPCVATIVVMRQELRNWRWLFVSLGLLLVISFGSGIGLYQGIQLLDRYLNSI